MSTLNPSLGWERLQNVFYRSRECFELQWSKDEHEEKVPINLDEYQIAIGPYASSIALLSTKTALELSINKSVEIYSGSGKLINSIPWLSSTGEIVQLGWNSSFHLILVMRSGKFRIYNDFEGDFDEYDLKVDTDVIEVKFWDTGFAARCANDSFKCVLDYDHVIPTQLSNINDSESSNKHVQGWGIVPPNYKNPIKLIICTESGVLISSVDNVLETGFTGKDITLVSVPPNAEFVALYSESAREVSIRTVDCKNLLSSYISDNLSQPIQLEWCSNDAVILSYKDELKLIGPSKDSLNFYTDSVTYLKTENDGLYFLNNERLEFLARVSNVTSDTFKIGSTSPSAILLDAIDQIDHHSPKANENLEIIKDQLIEAVDNCIRAAAEEFEPFWQKKLLRAASFGKATVDLYNSDEFVEVCNNLRVLNMIRQPEIGVFLTYSQFTELGMDKLIKLLLIRQLHYLCVKIADFLSLPTDEIFIDWACAKVKHSSELSDTDLLSAILRRILDKNVSFAPISNVAYQEGRLQLSIKLLSFEKDTSKTIPLLLEMEQDSYALLKSDESMDVDSIMYVLITLYNKLTLPEFFKILDNNLKATNIFLSKMAKNDLQLLGDYYYQADSIVGLANIELTKFNEEPDIELKKQHLNKASKLLARSKYTEFESRRLKDETKLIDLKYKLISEDLAISTVESPVALLEQVLETADIKKATKIHKDLKISEKQFYYKVVKTFAKSPERRQDLYEFATSKRSPIGYEPFYLELLRNGDKRQAALYVEMCSMLGYKEKVKCYLKCDDYKGAIDEAAKKKDIELLHVIRSLTDNTVHIRAVEDNLERLTGSRR